MTIRATELFELIGPRGDLSHIRQRLHNDIALYRRGRAERGRSAPVQLISDASPPIVITRQMIVGLLSARLEGRLDADELAYVLDAIDLSPSFSFANSRLEELVVQLGIDRPDEHAIWSALKELQGVDA